MTSAPVGSVRGGPPDTLDPARHVRRAWISHYRGLGLAYALAPLARVVPRRRPLVVICGPRTGSELLLRTLESSYGIHYDGEVTRVPLMHPVRYLTGRSVRHARGYACKIIDHQLREGMHFLPVDQVVRDLEAAGFLVVKLIREDRLAQVVSSARAWNNGQVHRRPGEAASPETTVDPDELISLLWRREVHAAWLDDALATVPHTLVRYEEDLADPARRADVVRAIGTACGWGAPQIPEDAPLARTSSGNLAADIANWPEVVARLSASRFAPLLPEASERPAAFEALDASELPPRAVSAGSGARP